MQPYPSFPPNYGAPPPSMPRPPMPGGGGASGSGGPLEVVEYAARVAFFAFVPFGVVLLSMLVPMGVAIVNMLLAIGAFFLGELLIGAADTSPILKRILRRQLAFEAYYRAQPPRPFLYYVFYPILMPYWLFVPEARREFLLFKGYTLVTLFAVSTQGAYRYFFVYQPDLSFRQFIMVFAITLVIETLAVMSLLMPMTTTVVALHRKGQHWRLVALLAVGVISAGVATTALAIRHRAFPSLETRQRVVMRSSANKPQSKAALKQALDRAWQVRHADPKRDGWERETDGTISGAPLDQARDMLEHFYHEDEAGAFELWTTSRREKVQMMVIFAEGRRKGNPVWLAMKGDGTVVDKITDVPRTARKTMRSAGDF